MKKILKLLAGFLALAAMAEGCGPVITVQNATNFAVRVVLKAGGTSGVVSPSPGNGSSMEAAEGPYTASAIPDQDWVEHAKLVRQDLNEQLSHADQLTGQKILELVKRLKDVALSMKQFEQAGIGVSCAGTITQDGGGTVVVSAGGDGALAISCH